jgi:hypothetical protein
MSMVMKLQMSETCQSQVHVTALRCLRVKPRKKGLNTVGADETVRMFLDEVWMV